MLVHVLLVACLAQPVSSLHFQKGDPDPRSSAATVVKLWGDAPENDDKLSTFDTTGRFNSDLEQIDQIVSPAGRCLNFLHIPKDAGSAVELQSAPHNISGYSSEVWATKAGALRSEWGSRDKALKHHCTHSDHMAPFKVPWPVFEGCTVSDGQNRSGVCSLWHVPPKFDARLAERYSQCETFCVARHPFHKMLSEYLYRGGTCTVAHFEAKVKLMMNYELEKNPFTYDCHYVRQVDYVYGNRKRADGRFCQRVLHLEDLSTEFNSLMDEYALPLTMQPHKEQPHSYKCPLQPSDISQEVLGLIQQYYMADYKSFGYELGKGTGGS